MFKDGDEHKLRDVTFTKERVIKELEKLRMDKIPGIDAMHPQIIKELREEVGEVLVDIMRISMITGEIPQDWKDSNSVPIYKKGN